MAASRNQQNVRSPVIDPIHEGLFGEHRQSEVKTTSSSSELGTDSSKIVGKQRSQRRHESDGDSSIQNGRSRRA
ncbi:hypothetical protein AMTR_s00085p00064620 [Amborella trichopoda]|uniref:Uncharacterized protein n=1 Tax=Amborella trichopoda TaxID=13333 RepID=W1P503_AMBTC|nr:hypothetical protein AMTR_s00085p00064620 [Amborella trichopoda]